ncbi:MAG: GMC oxidoreductase, partial [Polyangiaceae bacterium]
SPGLYVMDGSVLCGSTGVNPSATILAVAEHNVLEFIRARRQNPSWPSGDSSEGAQEYAAHRREAAKWRQKADAKEWRLEPPAKPKRYVDFTSKPLGLEFDEVMQGYCNGLGVQAAPSFDLLAPALADDALYRRHEISARPKYPVRVDLTASVANLSRFFEDYQHRLELRGKIAVDVPGLAYQGECRGHLDLFVPRYKSRGLDQNDQREAQQQITGRCYTTVVGTSEPSDERFMRYYLSFDGDRARLAGYKRIRQDPGLDAWRDTSALFTQIGRPRRGANGSLPELGKGQLDVIAAGVIHVDLTGFLYDQMPSFRVLGTTDEARRTWAITKFNTFFFGALQRVYAPEAQTALSALFGVKANDVHFGAGS